MSKILHIKLTQIQFLKEQKIQNGYFSFAYNDSHYFSSVLDNQTKIINDDIIINVGTQVPQHLILNRWQKHMILFTHYINISELKTKICIKKKYQTKSGQVLSFTICLLQQQQIQFTNKYVESLAQHYIRISNINIKNQTNRVFGGPSYFVIVTQVATYNIPVTNSSIILHVPTQLQLLYYRTGELFGKSTVIQYNRINLSTLEITLDKQGYYKGQVTMNIEWGINLKKTKIQSNVLIDSHQILIYDIEVKFQNFNEFTNSKVKIGYGNKAFQLVDNFSSSKITKFKKIIHFMMRSEQEQVQFIVDKNSKSIAHCRFLSQQITPFEVNTISKKIAQDSTGRMIGNIKFKCQIGKNLSVPSNNQTWREITRKKTASIKEIIVIEQISVKYETKEQLILILKLNQIQYKFYPLNNFNFYEDHLQQKNERAVISIKPEQSIYMILKKYYVENNSNEGDFVGIAVISPEVLRLGESAIQVAFFKNQQQTSVLSLKCNKIVPYQFLKPIFIPEQLISSSLNTMNISLFLNKINLTPYYHTYEYDGKNELYCIAEVNRIKKVLILKNVEHDELTFVVAPGSDNLEFIVEQSQFIKIKFVLMVSNVGNEEEIYAKGSLIIKSTQISNLSYNIQLLNSERNDVGKMMVEVGKSMVKSIKHKESIKANRSVQIQSQLKNKISEVRNSQPRNHSGSRKSNHANSNHNGRYTEFTQEIIEKHQKQIKLPIISEKKKANLDKVFDLMRIRKRGQGGIYDSNVNQEKSLNNIQEPYKYQPYKPPTQRQLNLKNIKKNNPNLDKNFEMLFPKKPPNQKKGRMQPYQKQAQQELDDKFKGLKSVYQEISHDIGQIQPTVKDSRENDYNKSQEKYYEGQIAKIDINNRQWEGNQFV